jgi:hypothetical protein
MHSYKDRAQTVLLYLKLGKLIKETIRQLVTDKKFLEGLLSSIRTLPRLRTGYVRAVPKYSVKQNHAAVDLYLDHDRCAAASL